MSHTYRSNAAEVGARMVAAIKTFGFRTTVEGKAVGEVIVEEIVEGIRKRSMEEQFAPSTGDWPENSEPYKSRKGRQYGVELTNVRTGQMLSAASLRGDTTIEDHKITMSYGTNEVMPDTAVTDRRTRERTSIGNVGHDVTDVDKASFANAQGRSFYELDPYICEANVAAVNKALGEHLKNQGR